MERQDAVLVVGDIEGVEALGRVEAVRAEENRPPRLGLADRGERMRPHAIPSLVVGRDGLVEQLVGDAIVAVSAIITGRVGNTEGGLPINNAFHKL